MPDPAKTPDTTKAPDVVADQAPSALAHSDAEQPDAPPDPAATAADAPAPNPANQTPSVKIASAAPATASKHDETIIGGKFLVRGRLVNAQGLLINEDGERVKANGDVLTPQELLAEQMQMNAQMMTQAVSAEAAG